MEVNHGECRRRAAVGFPVPSVKESSRKRGRFDSFVQARAAGIINDKELVMKTCRLIDRLTAKVTQLERIVVDAKECVKTTQERNDRLTAKITRKDKLHGLYVKQMHAYRKEMEAELADAKKEIKRLIILK